MKIIYLFVFLLIATICFANTSNSKTKEANEKNLVILEVIPQLSLLNKDSKENIIAFKFKIQKDWHIYWRNPGDSGLPTEIQLDTTNFTVSEIIWTCPERIESSEIVNYGYSDSAVLFVKIYPKKTINQNLELKGKAKWLVCKETCIAQSTTFSSEIKIGNEEKSNKQWEINNFDEIFENLPINLGIFKTTSSEKDKSLIVKFTPIPVFGKDFHLQNLQFVPFEGGIISNSIKQIVKKENLGFEITMSYDEYLEEKPKKIKGLLIGHTNWFGNSSQRAMEVELNINK